MWRIPFIVLLIPERLGKLFEASALFCHFFKRSARPPFML
jgi:hypothetical protein